MNNLQTILCQQLKKLIQIQFYMIISIYRTNNICKQIKKIIINKLPT